MKLTTVLFLALLLSGAVAAAAQDATFKDVKGKVEYQLPGQDWTPAKNGDVVGPGSMISTGFKSSANLSSMGSLISVKPLTRLALEELVKSATGTKTSIKLLSGKVKAEVRPKTENFDQQFDVKGPNATASVRGTGLDTDGESILVNHGEVEFTNSFGVSRSVQGGEFTSSGDGPSVAQPIAVKPAATPSLNDDGTVDEEAVTEQDRQQEEAGTAVDLEAVSDDFGDELDTGSVEPSVTDVLDEVLAEVIDDTIGIESASVTVVIQ